ncbi:secondary thiamine-phosphate synthase enzyme YjbQ [Oceanirhabdus sp. W0125-5]|uniref:secondary thiamine-phosphate synthase enzyme YjbQ n=1 Tax=Oceanirhabdus sp. W0125-5 TaxID=2999116 RepID=UPI0022F2DD42|nr:secondary thiamine-phosphate synthase enzyme YjbQ [Oceanirhabdus sp. W0125-5]WBW95524.1 secondary thiamine-phosphate synthase enzyme YjbQ [Oceanirhabdus sp. W0125-5]
MLFKKHVSSMERNQMIDITKLVRDCIKESNTKNGIAIVFCPHTTGAITINENCDRDVQIDMITHLEKVFPNSREFMHFEGNSDSHLKSTTVGASENIIIHNGDLLLGTWQGIYFCEFDGPRERTFYVKVQ